MKSVAEVKRLCVGGLRRWLPGRDRQNRHYLYGIAWKDREVRMVFEELGGRLV